MGCHSNKKGFNERRANKEKKRHGRRERERDRSRDGGRKAEGGVNPTITMTLV